MADGTPQPDYRVTLAELEREVHVPIQEQVAEQAQEPGESPLSEARLNLLRTVSIAHNGRW
jgi:hypothetical protein